MLLNRQVKFNEKYPDMKYDVEEFKLGEGQNNKQGKCLFISMLEFHGYNVRDLILNDMVNSVIVLNKKQ